MQELIFTILTNGKSLISKISVSANVITLIMHGPEQEHTYELTAGHYMQQTPPCEGNYSEVPKDVPLHAYLHSDTAPTNSAHNHFQHCNIITPNVFKSFLQQLKAFQENPAARQELYNDPTYTQTVGLLKLAQGLNINPPDSAKLSGLEKMLASAMYHASQNLKGYTTDIDTITPYITTESIEQAQQSYDDFYQKNQPALEARYQQIQLDLTWSDEFAEIRNNMFSAFLHSAGYAALQSTLKGTLKAHGLSESKTQWLVHTASLAVITATSSTWYPLIFAATTLAVLKTLQQLKNSPITDTHSLLASNIAATLTNIAQNLPMNAYGYLNLGLSLVTAIPTSIVTSKISGFLTQTFWQRVYNHPPRMDVQAVAVADASKPKLH